MIPRTKKTIKHRRGVPSGAHTEPIVIASEAKQSKSIKSGNKIAAPSGLAMTGLSKDGLPAHAFAIAPDPKCPDGWQLPHHKLDVLEDDEGSVDWLLLEKATLLLSLQGDEGRRISADPALIIDAARHITGHYRNAGKPIPDALCVLI